MLVSSRRGRRCRSYLLFGIELSLEQYTVVCLFDSMSFAPTATIPAPKSFVLVFHLIERGSLGQSQYIVGVERLNW